MIRCIQAPALLVGALITCFSVSLTTAQPVSTEQPPAPAGPLQPAPQPTTPAAPPPSSQQASPSSAVPPGLSSPTPIGIPTEMMHFDFYATPSGTPNPPPVQPSIVTSAPTTADGGCCCVPTPDPTGICSLASGRTKRWVCEFAGVAPQPSPSCKGMGGRAWCCQ